MLLIATSASTGLRRKSPALPPDPVSINGIAVPLADVVERARGLQRAFANLRMEIIDRIEAPARIVIVFLQRGRHICPLELPLGWITPTGREAEVRVRRHRQPGVWPVRAPPRLHRRGPRSRWEIAQALRRQTPACHRSPRSRRHRSPAIERYPAPSSAGGAVAAIGPGEIKALQRLDALTRYPWMREADQLPLPIRRLVVVWRTSHAGLLHP